MRGDEFDVLALYEALDARRRAEGWSWTGVAAALWAQSALLNAWRGDHPISPATLTGMARRGATTCQHALFVLRWLGVSPEHFVPAAAGGPLDRPLPKAGPDRRLRWDLAALHGALDAERRRRDRTWAQVAHETRCTVSQLTGLRTARFATGIGAAMRMTAWLERPAAAFVVVAAW